MQSNRPFSDIQLLPVVKSSSCFAANNFIRYIYLEGKGKMEVWFDLFVNASVEDSEVPFLWLKCDFHQTFLSQQLAIT